MTELATVTPTTNSAPIILVKDKCSCLQATLMLRDQPRVPKDTACAQQPCLPGKCSHTGHM